MDKKCRWENFNFLNDYEHHNSGLGLFFLGNFTEKTASNINNTLFGLGTNLLGIIVTVSFVQFFWISKTKSRVRI